MAKKLLIPIGVGIGCVPNALGHSGPFKYEGEKEFAIRVNAAIWGIVQSATSAELTIHNTQNSYLEKINK